MFADDTNITVPGCTFAELEQATNSELNNLYNWLKASLLAGGYWGFHRGKPFPFANRAPSWIFEARAPGYERVSAKVEGGGGGGKRKTACSKTSSP